MKKLFFGLSILLNILLFALCIYQMSHPKVQVSKDNSYLTYLTLQQQMPVNNGDIVFMGGEQVADCAWHEWLNNCKIKNRGVPGIRISNELTRLDLILGNAPSQLFLLFGIDDLNAGSSPDAVFEQYKKFVQFAKEKSPMTEIIIQSVLPVNSKLPTSKIKVKTADIEELNKKLKEFALANGIVFLNLYDDFSNEYGSLNPFYSVGDGFLLNATGYEMWLERVKPFVRSSSKKTACRTTLARVDNFFGIGQQEK
jgi:lysophospholipase L1-like esterase